MHLALKGRKRGFGSARTVTRCLMMAIGNQL